MLASLVGTFDATGDINTALDECCLGADTNFLPLFTQLQALVASLEQDRPVPESVLNRSLALANQLRGLGDLASKVETHAGQRIDLFTSKGIKTKETKLRGLEELQCAVQVLGRAKHLLGQTGNLALAIEIRTEAFLQLVQELEYKPNTPFAKWLAKQIDFFQPKLRLQLVDESTVLAKKANSLLFQQQPLPELLQRLGVLISLCVRFQIATSSSLALKEFTDKAWGIDIFATFSLMRFQYNFCSQKRNTSRVDRPEWFVGFCLESIRDRAIYIERELQPRCHYAPQRTVSMVVVDVLSQYIRCLVGAVHARLEMVWPVLADNPALLSHTIDELLVGDRALQQDFGYCAAFPVWPCMCSYVLESPARFEGWMAADLAFARARTSNNANSVLSLVEMLGKRVENGSSQVRQQYAENVQDKVLREFVSRHHPDLGALVQVKDRLLDWRLGADCFYFDSILELVESTLDSALEREAHRVFALVAGKLRTGWEERHVDQVVQLLCTNLATWKQQQEAVCTVALTRLLTGQLESLVLAHIKQHTFTQQQITSLGRDLDQMATALGLSSREFAKARVLVYLLSKYSPEQLGDRSCWNNDELFDLASNRASYDQLGLSLKALSRIRI
ncbi:hypothetical protein BASA81_006226 [Batrachochytrium salamandrivorans]|nr:hypothetical protein BASA81_006226 [Batrachochytrium salamandrivorans]